VQRGYISGYQSKQVESLIKRFLYPRLLRKDDNAPWLGFFLLKV
jgi:hypothetical protein